jgi:glyceraldehyde 3-phosphate dehydrogenase
VKKVIISAPAKNEDITIVLGVTKRATIRLRITSFQTRRVRRTVWRPVAKVVHEKFGIQIGADDDDPLVHKRSAASRSAAQGSATRACGGVVDDSDFNWRCEGSRPRVAELKGKFDGISVRVPTPNVSLVDVVMDLEKETTAEEVNRAFKDAANEELRGILDFQRRAARVVDFKRNSNSSIVDAEYTKVIGGTMLKVLSWYDNEWGYSCRVRDLIKYIASKVL